MSIRCRMRTWVTFYAFIELTLIYGLEKKRIADEFRTSSDDFGSLDAEP